MKPIVSDYLLEKIDLWLWDWDDTLVDTATYYTKNMNPEDIQKRTDEELNKDVPGWQYFVKLIHFLILKNKKVGIVSFGTYQIIQAYMNRMFNNVNNPFTKGNILTIKRDSNYKPLETKKNKNDFIYQLMSNYNIESSRTILFDDLINNVVEAIKFGTIAIHIPSREGLNNESDLTYKDPTLLFNEKTIDRMSRYIKKQIRMKENMIKSMEQFSNRKRKQKELKNKGEAFKQKIKMKFKNEEQQSKIVLFIILAILIILIILLSLFKNKE